MCSRCCFLAEHIFHWPTVALFFFLLHSIHKFVLSLKSDVTEKEKSLFYTYSWIEIKTFYMLDFNFINKLAENLPFLILKLSITFRCAGLNFVVLDWICCDKNRTDRCKKTPTKWSVKQMLILLTKIIELFIFQNHKRT